MSKKKIEELSKEELVAQLKTEQERSEKLQREKEQNDDARRKEEERASRLRADAEASKNNEPSEDQWLKLESEYEMTRDQIRSAWKIAQRVAAPLAAELHTFKTRDAAHEAVRVAKEQVRSEDPQFPKFERFVDEYLGDVSISDKADPEKLKKHLDRAVHFARSKARADKAFRDEEIERTRDEGSKEENDDAKEGFGSFSISGMPLTIENQKLVPDDFRKRHAHPELKGAVRMDEKQRWKEGIPVKPR